MLNISTKEQEQIDKTLSRVIKKVIKTVQNSAFGNYITHLKKNVFEMVNEIQEIEKQIKEMNGLKQKIMRSSPKGISTNGRVLVEIYGQKRTLDGHINKIKNEIKNEIKKIVGRVIDTKIYPPGPIKCKITMQELFLPSIEEQIEKQIRTQIRGNGDGRVTLVIKLPEIINLYLNEKMLFQLVTNPFSVRDEIVQKKDNNTALEEKEDIKNTDITNKNTKGNKAKEQEKEKETHVDALNTGGKNTKTENVEWRQLEKKGKKGTYADTIATKSNTHNEEKSRCG